MQNESYFNVLHYVLVVGGRGRAVLGEDGEPRDAGQGGIMDLKIGTRVIVVEHWRGHGKVGGWETGEWEYEIVKVNRVNVVARRVIDNRLSTVRVVKKDRVLRLKG